MERIIRTHQHRARHDYVCAFCGKPIPAGTLYCRTDLEIDGVITQEMTHVRKRVCDGKESA